MTSRRARLGDMLHTLLDTYVLLVHRHKVLLKSTFLPRAYMKHRTGLESYIGQDMLVSECSCPAAPLHRFMHLHHRLPACRSPYRPKTALHEYQCICMMVLQVKVTPYSGGVCLNRGRK
jgi:hypothetical protein